MGQLAPAAPDRLAPRPGRPLAPAGPPRHTRGMGFVRWWLAFAGVACAFGLSGAFCSHSYRDGMSVTSEAEAVGYIVFSGLLTLLAAVAARVILFVQSAQPRRDN
jgi:hypothetical protein